MCPSAKRDLGRSDLPKPSLLVDPIDIHISLEEICITIVIVVVVFFLQKSRCHQFSQSRGTDLKPLTFYFTLPAKSCLFPPVKESWTPSFFSPPPVHFPSEPPPLLLPFSSSVDTTEFARNPENVLNACTNHELIRN